MEKIWRKCSAKRAAWFGLLITVATGLFFEMDSAFSKGTTSLSEGISDGLSRLPLELVFILPVLAIVYLIVFTLCRKLGSIATLVIAGCLLLFLSIKSFRSNNPMEQLRRVSGQVDIPEVKFSHFKRLPSFSDGSAHLWETQCSEIEARRMINALGLHPILRDVPLAENSLITGVHPSAHVFEAYFDDQNTTLSLYENGTGIVAGIDAKNGILRLLSCPSAIVRNTDSY